jgi:hypothetical protein
MEQIRCGDQTVKFDREKTRASYLAIPTGDTERCGCSSCLNFAANRKSAYPQKFLLLLDQLGINPEKEGEAYECGPDGNSTIYGGWFYLVGELVVAGERMITEPGGFQYYFADAKRRPKPPVDFGEKVLALEFVTRLPLVPQQP